MAGEKKLDKVVQIVQSFVGNKIKGLQGNGQKKAEIELFVGDSNAQTDNPNSWTKDYVVSESLSIAPVGDPDEFIWNVLAGENPEGVIYLVVADEITQYMLKVKCPSCAQGQDYMYVYGTF